MNNYFYSLARLSETIEKCLDDSFVTCHKISGEYKNMLATFPFSIDLLGEALHTENLRETAHSRILYRILQYKDIQRNFIECFLPDVGCSLDNIQIPYPDKDRIDLTIKGNTFFLIIENKINGACEQKNQIDRYVQIARKTYPDNEIYVLYLGGESDINPSEDSISSDTRLLLNNRLICKNYKDDITPWIASVYEQIDFDEQPFLKSALFSYRTYLENKYNINNQYKDMNNKLDKTIIETFDLESKPLMERISIIEDQIDNLDKIRERLSDLLQDYKTQNIKEWYDKCSEVLSCHPILTMENSMEFGFNFEYRNTQFRCCVSWDDDPYWGIKGITEDMNSKPKIFESLQKFVLQSNKGFHNYEYNPKKWVVSDYERKEIIVERFITLTHIILDSGSCSLIE